MKNKIIYFSTLMLVIFIFIFLKNKFVNVPMLLNEKETNVNFDDGFTIGSWLWKSPDELSSQDVQELLSYSKKEKINTLYVDFTKYLDIIEDQNPELKQEKLLKFNQSVVLLLSEAKKYNISIEALAGNPKWASSDDSYLPPLLLNYVLNFNKNNPTLQIDGLQFDIEYYNQKGYKDSKKDYNSDFLKLVKTLSENVKVYVDNSNKNFKLGFAIPYWFDSANADYILNPLFDILNLSKHSYVAVMAYRNYAEGEGGTLNIISNELKYTNEKAQNVSIIVGQETNILDSKNTSFFGKTKQDLKKTANSIIESSKSYNSFKGIAIHDFYGFKNLKDN
ncbi:hypothetical protein BH10PAT1_BH10PAT1_2550 [soil metagenome]